MASYPSDVRIVETNHIAMVQRPAPVIAQMLERVTLETTRHQDAIRGNHGSGRCWEITCKM